jgi:hypothetical protein
MFQNEYNQGCVITNPPTGVDRVATRFTYPVNKQTLNATNYKAAANAKGDDLLTTRLFWDIKEIKLKWYKSSVYGNK